MDAPQTPSAFAQADLDWHGLVDAAVEFRRDLHRNPELTWRETETAEAIRRRLDEIGAAWRACAKTGTVTTLAPDAPGRSIALRADIDALPIVEQTGAAWASTREGCMHACGHDGHAATLMAAAAWLKRHERDLPGPVTLLFQPAEEGGHGAKAMIEDGALEGVEAIFGWHNWPAIPLGRAVCPDGPVMAGNGTFRIALKGAGGHSSQPEAARDPVLAASAVTLALQQIVARRLAPQHAAVVSVTSIDARSAVTIIPEEAVLEGSIRVSRAEDRDRVFSAIAEIARSTAAGYGVDAQVETFPRYGATVNHPHEAERMRAALAEVLGADWRDAGTSVPIMASEDFSYYLDVVPGAFALIGAGKDGGGDEPCHSPRYDFNDQLIAPVTRLYAALAGAPPPAADAGS